MNGAETTAFRPEKNALKPTAMNRARLEKSSLPVASAETISQTTIKSKFRTNKIPPLAKRADFVGIVEEISMLKEGGDAPDFIAGDENGERIKLTDFRGTRVVLYFYPKDDTPGCTKQACSLRDAHDLFTEKNIKVFGVSIDDETSHRKFIGKYNLPFTLLADTDKQIVDAYGVWSEKSSYGKKYMGVNRRTFLIDENGKIVKIFDKVDVSAHADEVLKAFGER